MGHLLGAEKGNFLIRGRGRPTVCGGRAGLILSIRGPEVSLGSPRVDTIHVQAPTPHAPALPSLDANQYRSSAVRGPQTQVPKVLDPELSREHQGSAHAVWATTRPQTYPRGRPRADLPPKKVCNLDLMAPRPRKKRQFF